MGLPLHSVGGKKVARQGVSLAPLLGLMAYWGYVSGINGSVAPFLAESFGLGDSGIAGLMAWIGLSSLGALALGRQVDLIGRRRVLLFCFSALPAGAIASALAPSPGVYAAAQLFVYALGGTLLATVTIVICEEGEQARRARGQSRAGIAFAAATALPLLLMASLSGFEAGWRWVWAAAALPLLVAPLLHRRLEETRRWREAEGRGEPAQVRMRDVFEPRYRPRVLRALAAVVLVYAAEFATRTWIFYHPIRTLGLEPGVTTGVLVVCGGLGLLGFPLGGRCADRFGRRSTFAVGAAVFAISAIGYYGVSLHAGAWRLPVLAASLFGIAVGGNAALVAFRALTSELFPTRLRGTAGGLLAVGGAVGWLFAMLLTSALAVPLDGLAPAVALLVATALPTAAVLLLRLPETAGLDLDSASLDRAVRAA